MPAGQSEPLLDDIAQPEAGDHAGQIERYNGQQMVSLTANIHGITLGEAAPKSESGAGGAGAPPRGVNGRHEAARFRRWSRPSPACASACCWRWW